MTLLEFYEIVLLSVDDFWVENKISEEFKSTYSVSRRDDYSNGCVLSLSTNTDDLQEYYSGSGVWFCGSEFSA